MTPDGYVVGHCRNDDECKLVSHLYKGTYSEPGEPMCALGWNRSGGFAYSIHRGATGAGICKVCVRRALAGLPPVPPRERKTRWL